MQCWLTNIIHITNNSGSVSILVNYHLMASLGNSPTHLTGFITSFTLESVARKIFPNPSLSPQFFLHVLCTEIKFFGRSRIFLPVENVFCQDNLIGKGCGSRVIITVTITIAIKILILKTNCLFQIVLK